ncbi:MAG: 16S rRNA (adenine(1518)-N(6)/adenine(1519)-N(6))-dimethyltransferase RsmA [Desulfobacteraceae bacterium]
MRKDNKRGLKPNKRLGQHFLVDRNIINQIIEKSGLDKSDDVLEIGPGMGALTIPIAGVVNSIIAVEKDERLVNYLRQKLGENHIENVTVINNDILKTDLEELAGSMDGKPKVIGNLPYNISSPLLEKLISNKKFFSKAFLMLQYEFARRLASDAGSKDYGAITVMTKYESSITELLKVGRDVFYPKPKVGSMVIAIDLEMPHPVRAKNDRIFELVVRGAFARRRKTIKNSLKVISSYFEKEQISSALDICGIDPLRRAETLSLDEFLSLSDTLSKNISVV